MENAAASVKKRKLSPTHSFQLKTQRLAVLEPENSASSVDSGYSAWECSDNVIVSAVCSSHGSSGVEKVSSTVLDLEIQKGNIDEEIGDSLDCRERRETSLLIEVQSETDELESTARPLESISRRPTTAGKMPSEDELEEFFAVAEKNLQKEFIAKYNFDIAKDAPLEGRYEWVHIQEPKPS
ncbi:cyclin-dependent kinase inhibitor 7-like [Dorcoceras hygrometricum]|uniref:Cyclin-dependent kinase inhibitor 7-like n=1 Tax=Dorcoceras hygrometricum TaxID=472368 RepID=A0A2Z7C673_9LAMI|nr:cyclin-dependent kinase inhibitor 7-like [Dorcoceras hygrometricum]